MSSRIAYPHLRLSSASVTQSPWVVSVAGSAFTPLGDQLGSFDAASTVELASTLRVDPPLAARELQLSERDLHLVVCARAGTGSGRLPRRVLVRHQTEAISEGAGNELRISLSGRDLSVAIHLETEVVLAEAPEAPGMLSPVEPGARLWSSDALVRLEDEEPRFPIEIVDFGELFPGAVAATAPWYLYWSPRDWERDFHGCVRLYLNRSAEDFIARIEEQDPAAMSTMLADIMGQIVERLLLEPDAAELIENPEPGSLAAQAGAWLGKAWPGKDVEFIREILMRRPGRFRATFAALAELQEVA